MKIGILGTSVSQFGELWDKSLQDLAVKVGQEAVERSQLTLQNIDALYVGNMLAGILESQENFGAFVADALSLFVPTVRVEAACASGGLAVHSAAQALSAGTYKTVLVLGVEKMTDHMQDEVSTSLMSAGGAKERFSGITFAGLYALLARVYMEQYKVGREDLAMVSVKNHYHATFNSQAQFRSQITVADVLKSTKVADPLHLFDCSPISDGAAAVVLTTDEKLLKKQKKSVYVVASEVDTDTLAVSDRDSLTSLKSAVKAAARAYKKAGVKPSSIDVLEVHDCFSIAEILAVEDLGLSKKGKGASDIAKQKYTLGVGRQIVNPSGGLKACGHPIGATGVKQIAEITTQLRLEAGMRQVKNARIGLTHNVAGSGSTTVIHILKRI